MLPRPVDCLQSCTMLRGSLKAGLSEAHKGHLAGWPVSERSSAELCLQGRAGQAALARVLCMSDVSQLLPVRSWRQACTGRSASRSKSGMHSVSQPSPHRL